MFLVVKKKLLKVHLLLTLVESLVASNVITSGERNKYMVRHKGSGDVCAILSARLKFEIRYKTTTLVPPGLRMVYVGNLVSVGGACGEKHQNIVIKFSPKYSDGDYGDEQWTLKLEFERKVPKEGTDGTYAVSGVQLDYVVDKTKFKDVESTTHHMAKNDSMRIFETSVQFGFSCDSETRVTVNKDVTLVTSELSMQAFKPSCAGDATPLCQRRNEQIRTPMEPCAGDDFGDGGVASGVGIVLAAFGVLLLALYAFIEASASKKKRREDLMCAYVPIKNE